MRNVVVINNSDPAGGARAEIVVGQLDVENHQYWFFYPELGAKITDLAKSLGWLTNDGLVPDIQITTK